MIPGLVTVWRLIGVMVLAPGDTTIETRSNRRRRSLQGFLQMLLSGLELADESDNKELRSYGFGIIWDCLGWLLILDVPVLFPPTSKCNRPCVIPDWLTQLEVLQEAA